MSIALHRRHAALLVTTAALFFSLPALAQGGAGGGGGAGAGSGASGPGAAAAGHGAAAPAAGQNGQPGTPNGTQQNANSAAGAAPLGPDPRKPPAARPGALTLQQVIDRGRLHNPTLLAAQLNLSSVRAQEIQAGVRANPYFTAYGQQVTEGLSSNSSNPALFSFQVSRLFERGEKRRYRLDAARANTAQTASQLEDQIRQTVLSIKQAFTKMLIAKDALELATASLADYRHEVQISEDRYKAGDMAKLDYERLDLQLGSFESDESNDIVNLQQASAQLQTLIGIDSPNNDFDILGDVVPPNIPQTREALVQAGLTARPDLAAARNGVLAADANARLAVANGTTDPTLEGEYDRIGPDNSAGFSINIPLRIFDRNQGNKATTRYLLDSTRFTETAARNQVVSDVDQAWVGYIQAKRLSNRFTEHYLDESRDVLGIAQYAFEHGGLALIDYLDALRDARTSTSDALNAYAQTWQSIHQLSAAAATELTP